MQLFLKFKNDKISLKNGEVIEYEYNSLATFCDIQFCVRIVLDFNSLELNQDALDCIRKWIHQYYEDENYYKNLSFGAVSMENVIKEITFSDAYVFKLEEKFDIIKSNLLVVLDIKQKKDKFQKIKIYPQCVQNSTNLENQYFEDNLVSIELKESNSAYDFETQNIKSFKEKLKKQKNITPEYEDALVKKFSYAPEIVQNIFLNYVPDNSVDFVYFKQDQNSGYDCITDRIEIDLMDDLINPKGSGVTYFHEHGHLIDLREVRRTGIDSGLISDDSTFIRLLTDDFENYIQKYREENNLDIEQTYSQISEMMFDLRYRVVSDLFGAISKGKCQGICGHPQTYWEQNSNMLEQEAVAHFFELQFDLKRLEITKEFFPNSIKRFERLLRIVDKSYSTA